MKEGELCARSSTTGQPVRLRWQGGKIISLEAASEAPRDLWLVPALVDLQVNGYGGVDFQQDDVSLEDLLAATRKLRAAACTRFLLTLVTDAWPRLMARLRHFRELRSRSAELRAAIAGWHVEGPFLSAEPGFCGAHNPEWMCDPTAAQIHEIGRASCRERV